jgi:hypothetical protein
MINQVTMKPTFLEDAEVLMLGVRDSDELKNHLAADFKFGDEEIVDDVTALKTAVDAEAAVVAAVGDQIEEKAAFEELFNKAQAWVEKHSQCLQMEMDDCPQIPFLHSLVNPSPFMPLSDWFEKSTEMYYRVLLHSKMMVNMACIGITRQELEGGLKSVLDAMKAREKLKPKDNENVPLFEKRDWAFEELSEKFKRLQTFCLFIFADHPELLEKPAVSNLSPIVFTKMVKDSSITRKIGMVKDSSITRKILLIIENLFKQVIKKYFDPGTTWKAWATRKSKKKKE